MSGDGKGKPCPPRIIVGESSAALSRDVAEYVRKAAEAAIAARGRFVAGISGGSLPAIVGKGFTALASSSVSSSSSSSSETKQNSDNIDWTKCHFFFVDERCVPLDHADSNFKECRDKWFGLASSQCGNSTKAVLHPINADLADQPEKCAAEYAQQIFNFFSTTSSSSSSGSGSSSNNDNESKSSSSAENIPEFDLLLLGMGPDGHTCSLFPQHKILTMRDRIVAHITDSPKPPSNRVTFTLPLTNAARDICFVCTGAGKKDALKQVVAEVEADVQPPAAASASTDSASSSSSSASASVSPLPSSLVRPQHGAVPAVWFVDKDAASALEN